MALDSAKIFFDLIGRTSGERDIDRFAKALGDSGDEAERASKGHRDLTEGTRALSTELERARTRSADLRREFHETGNTDLLKDMTKAERDIKRFEGLFSKFGDSERGIADAARFFATGATDAAGATDGWASKLPGLAGQLGPVGLAIAGVGAAGVLVAALAVTGGVAVAGLGGALLALGIKAQVGTANVSDALDRLSKTWNDVGNAAGRMIGRELTSALGSLRDEVDKLEPTLDDLFTGPATAIVPLEHGLEGLIEHAMPGLMDGADASSSALQTIAGELPNLGDVVGQFFTDVSSNSEAGVDAMMKFVNVIEITIGMMGKAIRGAENLWTITGKVPGVTPLRNWIGSLADADTQQQHTAVSARILADHTAEDAAAAEKAAESYKSFADAIGLINADSLSLAQAQLASADATQRVSEAVKTANGHLAGNSDAARRAREAILSALPVYAAQTDANFKVSGSSDQSTKAFQRNLEALRQTTPAGSQARAALDGMIHQFTITKAAALTSADSVGAVNAQINRLHDKKVKAEAQGDSRQVAALNAQINALHNKTVYVNVVGRTLGEVAARAGGGGMLNIFGSTPGRASGGPVRAGHPYIVGEKRPELFVPDGNGMIYPDVSSGGSAAGGTVINNYINVTVTNQDPQSTVRAIQLYAQQNGTIRIKGGVTAV